MPINMFLFIPMKSLSYVKSIKVNNGGHSDLVVSILVLHLQVWGFDSCLQPVCTEMCAHFARASGVLLVLQGF